jgi:predicted alpha/beta-hydrolase family hydrolase
MEPTAPDQELSFSVKGAHRVSGLLRAASDSRACFVLAHGAGAGMRHSFMQAVAAGLSVRGIATFRYNFPYMESGGRRVDRPELAHATVRAAVQEAGRLLPEVPLVAGGKSFGGRMTSQAQAASPLPGVCGLAFLGFPLHPAGKPSDQRARHLAEIELPMLFLQGTRDQLADVQLLQSVVERLGSRATLTLLQDADHSFHVPARTGRRDLEVLGEAMDELARWVETVCRVGDGAERGEPR